MVSNRNSGETIYKPVKVFESHTKLDSAFCDVFDRACARVGVDAFRSEYESIEPPAWLTIRDELSQSKALFLLVGDALVKAQAAHEEEWEYTQNWISYEIGIASALNLDIWVLTTESGINFPVPYFNNYMPSPIHRDDAFKYLVAVLKNYTEGHKFGISDRTKVTCPDIHCGITFNLQARFPKSARVACPCCLKGILLPNGHLAR